MVSYCDNVVDCRRRLVLAHFGEAFDATQCALVAGCACDNCTAAAANENRPIAQRDLTVDARALTQAVVEMVNTHRRNITLNYLVDVFRGKACNGPERC